MPPRIVSAILVTVVEAPAVYAFIQLYRDEQHWLAIGCLVVGEFVETALGAYGVRSRMSPIRVGDPDGARPHRRKLQLAFGLATTNEVLIWVVWLELASNELRQLEAGAVLLVLMHLKHQLETTSVRDTGYATGLLSPRGLSASASESAGAAGCLALIVAGEPLLAAAALAGGLLIEHLLLIGVLYRALAERDISLPRLRRPPLPRGLRLLAFVGTRFGAVWRLLPSIGPIERLLNRRAIDLLVNRVPPRPNPLSTMASYTSWASLTDQTWSGRHLPPAVAGARGHPELDAVAALFRRDGAMTPCPRSTVLFAYFAQWFTDGFLRTQRAGARRPFRDTTRNESTHAVDLSQLYGLNAETTHLLRLKRDGLLRSQQINGEEYPEYLCTHGVVKWRFRKLIRPFGFENLSYGERNQLFAMGTDTRNLGFVAFNVLFLREHNRIARQLAAAHPDWDDERLFGTARTILIVVLIRIVVEEYINHITGFHFQLRLPAPATFSRAPWQRPNWMAIEFNLLYRWHSLVPATLRLGGEELAIAETLANTKALTSRGLRAFMLAASQQRAGRIGLFNTDALLVEQAEKPSIAQARAARVRSYNDYRELCGLPRVRHFGELSTDPRVKEQLMRLYDHVEDVEFYVGLFAEEGGRNDVLPPLMAVMVAFDAFSQVLTNPLVSPQVYGAQTFSATGMQIIAQTSTLRQLVARNVQNGSDGDIVSMTWRAPERR